MLDQITDAVSSLAAWASGTGRDHGPAVGRRSRRAWRGLALLGRVQLWVVVALVVALALTWTYAT